jgi:chromosome segregation ATPase
VAKLEILTGKQQGTVIDLQDGDFDIGNRKSAQISIRDRWISYNHARISSSAGRFVIEDLGSSNGTWIDGEKIKRHELSGDTLIYLGKTKIRFEGAVAAAAAGGQPWWDKVIDGEGDEGEQTGPQRARSKRLEAELAGERGMRRALERYFDLPEGSRIGDAAKAGALQTQVEELTSKLKDAEKGGGADTEAAVAEATERLRREHMSKVVELEARATSSESRAVELESRLGDKTTQSAKEVERVKESLQSEIEDLRGSLEEARKAASESAGGDEALQQERDRATTLEKDLGESRDRVRELEEQTSQLESTIADAKASGSEGAGEEIETLKTQLWAAVEEATKWKEDARQHKDSLEESQAEADKAKAEHAQVVQEIDEISMEQIEIEEELNLKVQILCDRLVEITDQDEDAVRADLQAAFDEEGEAGEEGEEGEEGED